MAYLSQEDCGKIEILTGESQYDSLKVIKAIANPGYVFARWIGDYYPADPKSQQISLHYSDGETYKNVTALFRKDFTYTVSIVGSPYGSCTIIDFESYPQHKRVVANPIDGYMFKRWQSSSGYVVDSNKSTNPIDLYMAETNRTASIEAIYEEDPNWTKLFYQNGSIARILVDGDINNQHVNKSGTYQTNATVVSACFGLKVTGIADRAFMDCSKLTAIAYTTSLSSIGTNAFSRTSLTAFDFEHVDASTIGENAFSHTQLSSIDKLSKSISSIQQGCFRDCSQLTSAIFPSTLRLIDDYVFYGCYGLSVLDFTSYSGQLPTISSNTFSQPVINRKISIRSTDEALLVYQSDGPWKDLYPDIDPKIPYRNCTILAVDMSKDTSTSLSTQLQIFAYMPQGETCTIDWGDSASIDGSEDSIDRYAKQTKVKQYDDCMSYIHTYGPEYRGQAFDISVSNELTSIKVGGMSIAALVQVKQFGQNIVYLPAEAFSKSSLGSIYFPSTITSMGKYPLMNCKNMDITQVAVENGGIYDANDHIIVLSSRCLVQLWPKDR